MKKGVGRDEYLQDDKNLSRMLKMEGIDSDDELDNF
jgi:hypothetical protein